MSRGTDGPRIIRGQSSGKPRLVDPRGKDITPPKKVRCARMPVDPVAIFTLLTAGADKVLRVNGIPEDAEYRTMVHDPATGIFWFFYTHPSLDEVEVGKQVPIKEVSLKIIEVPQSPEDVHAEVMAGADAEAHDGEYTQAEIEAATDQNAEPVQ